MFIFAAVGAIAAPFGILGVIYTMLAYLRPRLSPQVADAQAPVTSVVPKRGPRRFMLLALFLAALSSICLLGIVLYAGRQPTLPRDVLLTGNTSFDGTPLGMQWASAVIRPISSNDPTASLKIQTFSVFAKVFGNDAITLRNAFLELSVDSANIPMSVGTPPGPMYPIEQIKPIQPDTWIYFEASFGNAGLSESEFIDRWRSFRLVIKYDEKTVRRDFDANWVLERIAALHPNATPHVSPKQ